MRKIIYFLPFLLLIVSCSVKQKPIFLKVDDIKLLSASTDTVRIGANAYFENPNDIGGKIATDEIKVLIDQVEVAQVSSEEFKVPARKEFHIPLKVVIPAKKVFENNKNGILGGILNSLINQRLRVHFKGDLKYKVLGFSHIYPIDKVEDLKIKF
ncbi:late embryogenesis abundant protein [Tenacibaculum gallaicum]|uniref:Late embryogenesis abundant protein n=1 Tax=Tenacibaculum gallaicum TaxID=561505 RepID=A0A3E0HQP3_9FLAO|nr:LEA type 2 family protein [Tenacibaculum gallaicum]REH48738.1 late embryogenesis abundant protein [Tenacibaculum gallaicum]